MADCLIYSSKGPALGKRDIKGLKLETIPALREFTFITVYLPGTLQVGREHV